MSIDLHGINRAAQKDCRIALKMFTLLQCFDERLGDAGQFRSLARMCDTNGENDEPIVIKKYANRRLYNTGTSTYVTLEDLAAMVKQGEDFLVQDAKTGDDITRSVLTQIIFEQENKAGQNLLPIPFLRQLISFYGDRCRWWCRGISSSRSIC